MICKKCGYSQIKEYRVYGSNLCSICVVFAPTNLTEFQNYIMEKVDWKTLESYRKFGHFPGRKQKEGMEKKAIKGKIMTRPAWGYSIIEGKMVQNGEAGSVHSLFRTFLNSKYSLNALAENFGLSTNGLKKVLKNRAYLGETKFGGKIYKGDHKAIITPDLYYAVQRKLEQQLKK